MTLAGRRLILDAVLYFVRDESNLMKNNKKIASLLAGSSALLMTPLAFALQDMSDGELSSVSGQDGLTVSLGGQITADNIQWLPDSDRLDLDGVTIQSIDLDGANPGVSGLGINAMVDAGTIGGTPSIRFGLDWSRMRVRVDAIRNGADVTNSIGTAVLDSSGSFSIVNQTGLFNTANTTASLYMALTDADYYYKQGTGTSPEIMLHDLDFLWDMPSGIVGIDSQGILVEGDVNFNMTFDLLYDESPSSQFTRLDADDRPVLRFGWTGGLTDAQVRVRPGGSWLASSLTGAVPNQTYDQSAKTEGINLSMRWDYEPTFRWIVGEAEGNRSSIEFGNWTKLPGAGYGFDLPLLALDMIDAGEGPGGLCWGANWSGPASSCTPKGGQYLDIAPENNAMAILIRDLSLRAYSSSVKVIDAPNPDLTFGWALIYTWGNVDSNLYFYPGGDGTSTGVRADILVTNQTFDSNDADGDGNIFERGPNWEYGTHFMIGDTDLGLAIGFTDSAFLVAANDMYFSLTSGVSGGLNLNSDQVRLQMKGQFGGGDIPDLNQRIKAFDLDINLEMDQFDFTLRPAPPGESYLGYDATVRFTNSNIANFSQNTAGDVSDDGTYISLAEPSKPDVDFRFADIRGSMGFRNGRLDIRGDVETGPDLPPQLVISNDIVIGTEVAGGSVFQINRVEFGNNNLGTIVIPQGQWHSALTLSPKY